MAINFILGYFSIFAIFAGVISLIDTAFFNFNDPILPYYQTWLFLIGGFLIYKITGIIDQRVNY